MVGLSRAALAIGFAFTFTHGTFALEAEPVEKVAADKASEPVGSEPVGSGPVAAEKAKSKPSGSDPVGSEPTGGEPVVAEPEISNPVILAVLDAIGSGPRGSNDRERAEIAALEGFYKSASRKPVWVDAKTVLAKAKTLVDKIGRADDYGLDAADYKLPALDGSNLTPKDLGRIELALTRAVQLYARHAKGGRTEPGKVGTQLYDAPKLPEPGKILADMAAADDPAAYLKGLHPKHPQFEMLRKKYVELRGSSDKRKETRLPSKGPVLKRGVSHEQVILLRKRLNIEVQDEQGSREEEEDANTDPEKFDAKVETAVKAFQKEAGLKADGIVGPGTRKALNGESSQKRIYQLLINMERWRWLPDDLDGDAGIYVWANIPEFRVRIIREGKKVFDERVIVGKTDKQTPVFSDKMEWIEFHPTWYVPNSIKVADILPSLKRRTSRVMERYHLKLNCGRHGSDPTNIDWSKVNIRNCSVTQPPGKQSVLGDFKFKFPNKHAVYMHDTLTRGLFNRTTRTFSHGCLRIRNPRRMAEILLDHDKGMTSGRIGKILAGPRRLHTEKLNKHVPVHITYFTIFFDDEGKLKTRADYYGNDRRLARALVGKGHLFSVPAVATSRKRVRKKKRTSRRENWYENHSMQN